MTDELLISLGGNVKSLTGGKVGGYLVVFGDSSTPDISHMRDYFTTSTDFDLESGIRPAVLYHHGLDLTLKRRKIGRAELSTDAIGVWVEAQLALRDEFEKTIYALAQKGKLKWSSGSVGHLVELQKVGDAHEILAWPIAEASLTPSPAQPGLTQVLPLKSYLMQLEGKRPMTPRQRQAEATYLHAKHTIREGELLTGAHPMTSHERQAEAAYLHAKMTIRAGEML